MPDILEITPLHIQGLCDFHVHCDYSIDAEGTIEDYCRAALNRGLAEICFTTHFDYNPDSYGQINFIRVDGEDLQTTVDNLVPYVDHVHRAADEFYAMGLSVKLGVEFGWYPGGGRIAEKLKKTYPFDYFLCGFHELDNVCFASRRTATDLFATMSPEELVRRYYEGLTEAAGSGLFDAIAHASYYLRYGPAYYGHDMQQLHRPYIESFFRALQKSNTAIEINTSGIRHGHDHYYPTVGIINEAKEAGVRIDHLGSDSHHPTQIGLDFEIASALIPSNIRNCESD